MTTKREGRRIMADIGTIEKAMRQIAPPHLAEEWDNCGFQIRCDSDQNIEKILVCLEISDDIITEAIQKSADLIVTHHPLIFGGIRSVDMDDMTGRYVLRLIRAGISVYSAHTSFDSAKDGTNQYLAECLGLEEISPLVPAEDGESGMGRAGVYRRPLPFSEFALRLKDACDGSIFRISGTIPEFVSKVSLCTGAGSEFIGEAEENASDVYITGDVKYHDARTACEKKFCIIDAGHFGTENIFTPNFAGQLRKLCPQDVEIMEAESDLDPFRLL